MIVKQNTDGTVPLLSSGTAQLHADGDECCCEGSGGVTCDLPDWVNDPTGALGLTMTCTLPTQINVTFTGIEICATTDDYLDLTGGNYSYDVSGVSLSGGVATSVDECPETYTGPAGSLLFRDYVDGDVGEDGLPIPVEIPCVFTIRFLGPMAFATLHTAATAGFGNGGAVFFGTSWSMSTVCERTSSTYSSDYTDPDADLGVDIRVGFNGSVTVSAV